MTRVKTLGGKYVDVQPPPAPAPVSAPAPALVTAPTVAQHLARERHAAEIRAERDARERALAEIARLRVERDARERALAETAAEPAPLPDPDTGGTHVTLVNDSGDYLADPALVPDRLRAGERVRVRRASDGSTVWAGAAELPSLRRAGFYIALVTPEEDIP